jgi:type II secretory pathway pseudopilin PulG
MLLPKMIPTRRSSSAFTLAEMMVVILIIATLVALSIAGISAAQNAARKAQVKNDLGQIITAVKGYYSDYGSYPLNSAQIAAGVDTVSVYGNPNGTYSSADLFNILRAKADTTYNQYNQNNQLNPKGIVYFNGKDAGSATAPRGGFATAAATSPKGYSIKKGALVDPWGSEYIVWLDVDYNNEISSAAIGLFYNNPVAVPGGVAACSLGKDGKWGKNGDKNLNGSDDIVSWQ